MQFFKKGKDNTVCLHCRIIRNGSARSMFRGAGLGQILNATFHTLPGRFNHLPLLAFRPTDPHIMG